jgi:hypothetical protein
LDGPLIVAILGIPIAYRLDFELFI